MVKDTPYSPKIYLFIFLK